jgi:hypothetical protein
MSHPDDEVLAGMALGESVTDTERAHIDECAQCHALVADLATTKTKVGALTGRLALERPPAHLWKAIEADVSEETPWAGSSPAAPEGVHDELAARRTRKRSRSGGSMWMVGAAAAAGLVIGGVAVGNLTGQEQPGQLVASAALSDLATEDAVGTATVHTNDDGTEVLMVDTAYEPVDGAYLEVWLIDPNVEGMISLGPLTGGSQTFAVPDGFEVSAYPIVDVSVEPFDGDPTHSGESITRGVLDL